MRASFGKRGREISIQRYSTDVIIPQYIAFYEKVLDRTRTSTSAAGKTP